MPISSLFAGMEAYLDGDINYTDTVDDTAIAEQTAEVASDTADASEEAKDTEVASQMLSRMCDMYDHVKQFGIDRTFVSLYNRHGELDRVCGMRFPSCESMDVVGDCYSMYSTAFIAAMESSGSGLWAKIKAFIAKIWNWIKNVASKIWEKIKALFGFKKKRWQKIVDFLKRNKGKIAISAGAIAAITAATIYIKKIQQINPKIKEVQQTATEVVKNAKETIRTVVDPSVPDDIKDNKITQLGEQTETLEKETKEIQTNTADAKKLSYMQKLAFNDIHYLIHWCKEETEYYYKNSNDIFNHLANVTEALREVVIAFRDGSDGSKVINKNQSSKIKSYITRLGSVLAKLAEIDTKTAAKLNYFDTKVLEKMRENLWHKSYQYNHDANDKAVELYKNNAPDPQDLQDVYNEVARNYPGELDAI